MVENASGIFKCLSDKSRLRIITNLLNEPMYVELLSKRLDLSPSTVSFHLKKLEAAGLITSSKEQYYVVYEINERILERSLKSFLQDDDEITEEEYRRQEEYKEKVIKSFFEYDKLKSIPVQRKKRRIILEKMMKSFEYHKEYTEKDVNIIIADYHDDFCTLRRAFIEEKLLEREDGVYRRV